MSSATPLAASPAGITSVPGTEELRATLIEVMHGQRRHLERCAAQHGLSGQLAIALLQLRAPWPAVACRTTLEPAPEPGEPDDAGDGGPGMPMRELAGRISCDPSQVTGIADRLEDLGLVERRPNPQDRRVKLLVVTDAGDRVATQLAEEINRGAPGFSVLADQERTDLLRLLRKVAASSAE